MPKESGLTDLIERLGEAKINASDKENRLTLQLSET
jgi:hypothetical protein